jgi:glycerol-3-phosphate dehydrogenase
VSLRVRKGPSRTPAHDDLHCFRMRRDLTRLSGSTFDLLVVGAGIHGVCAAWDAALRGLSVAIVDQDDFGAATSANSLRIIHGGLRYLARGELGRMTESVRERSTLLRIAPGLTAPLPVLVPTYGAGSQSRAAFRVALGLNDLLSSYRNRGLDPARRIPAGRLVSRDQCLRLFPAVHSSGLTGGALWFDAQMLHPERLTFSFVRAATKQGAVAANYLRVDQLRTRERSVVGARVTDRLTGSGFDIQSRAVLVAAGPWTHEVVANTINNGPAAPRPRRAFAMNVVLTRRLAEVAVGVRSSTARCDDPICGGGRFIFMAPQGGSTVLGTWYAPEGQGDAETLRERGVRALLDEFNVACPGLGLSLTDVARCQWGWLPLKSGWEPGRPDTLAERARVIDHGRSHGIRHLHSLEGVKYTTARRVAEQTVNQIMADLGRAVGSCRTAEIAVASELEPVTLAAPGRTAEATLQAVREEMAVKLSDVVFRRTSLGSVPAPERTALEEAARAAGAELGWDATRREAEIQDVLRQTGRSLPAMEAVG